MYFTPDGRYAIVVAERLQRLDFRDPHTFALHHSLHGARAPGVDHMDFSADGRYLLASCEFSGQLVKVDVAARARRRRARPARRRRGMPQDVKLSPDGSVFYVADMMPNGVWEIDGRPLEGDRLPPDRHGRARPLPEPRREATSTSRTAARARSR